MKKSFLVKNVYSYFLGHFHEEQLAMLQNQKSWKVIY